MDTMDVFAVISELHEFGNHLPVGVGLSRDPEEEDIRPVRIEERTVDGELMVVILPA